MKRILSIDGGGMRGRIPTLFLAALEAELGFPIYKLFDGLAGTSIGGIVSCLLTAGFTAHEVDEFFTVDGPVIFGSYGFEQDLLGFQGLHRPRYTGDKIEKVLQNRLGAKTLETGLLPILIPSLDVLTETPMIFKTGVGQKDYPLWQIARATSAAQTYFPGFKLDGMALWDGGNITNNPAARALTHFSKMWPNEPIKVLSLGCGDQPNKLTAIEGQHICDGDIFHVVSYMLTHALDVAPKLVDDDMIERLGSLYLRVQPDLQCSIELNDATSTGLRNLLTEANRSIAANLQQTKSFYLS